LLKHLDDFQFMVAFRVSGLLIFVSLEIEFGLKIWILHCVSNSWLADFWIHGESVVVLNLDN